MTEECGPTVVFVLPEDEAASLISKSTPLQPGPDDVEVEINPPAENEPIPEETPVGESVVDEAAATNKLSPHYTAIMASKVINWDQHDPYDLKAGAGIDIARYILNKLLDYLEKHGYTLGSGPGGTDNTNSILCTKKGTKGAILVTEVPYDDRYGHVKILADAKEVASSNQGSTKMNIADRIAKKMEEANIITREVAAPSKKSTTDKKAVSLSKSDFRLRVIKPTATGRPYKVDIDTRKSLPAPGTQAMRDKLRAKQRALSTIIKATFKNVKGGSGVFTVSSTKAIDAKFVLGKLLPAIEKYNKANGYTKREVDPNKPKPIRAAEIVREINNGSGLSALGITDKEAVQILVKALSRGKAKK